MHIADTMTCGDFLAGLRGDTVDLERGAAIVSTHDPRVAESIGSLASARGVGGRVLVLEYSDVEDGLHPQCFTPHMARAVCSFVSLWNGAAGELLSACDGARSRSSAIAAASSRITGQDDLHFWITGRYSPNLLVYARTLQAAGMGPSDEQLEQRRVLKSAVASARAEGRPIHGMHLFPAAYDAFRRGGKRAEIRLLDAKRAKMRPQDLVVFGPAAPGSGPAGDPADGGIVVAVIESLHIHGDFHAMFDRQPELAMEAGFADAGDAERGLGEIYPGSRGRDDCALAMRLQVLCPRPPASGPVAAAAGTGDE